VNASIEKEQDEKLQQIPKWARRYAQTRTVPVLIALVVALGLCAAVGIPSYLAGNAYRSGNTLSFWICVCLLVLALAAVAFFSIPRWGGRLLECFAKRYYSKEGYVSLGSAVTKRKKALTGVVGASFGFCILASVVLGNKGYYPLEYMQPVSALYMVPFMTFLVLIQRPVSSLLGLLWPLLYGVHAALIVCGVPIQFRGSWQFLDMLVPVVGYGILANSVCHLYNRFALHRMRGLAHTEAARRIGEN